MALRRRISREGRTAAVVAERKEERFVARTSKAYRRRQAQLRAVVAWIEGSMSGDTRSLAEICAEHGTDTRGLRKLLATDEMARRIEGALSTEALVGLSRGTRLLLEKLDDADTSVNQVVRIVEHMAKLRYGGYRPANSQQGPVVAVQINLPPGMERPEVRSQVVENSGRVLGDALL